MASNFNLGKGVAVFIWTMFLVGCLAAAGLLDFDQTARGFWIAVLTVFLSLTWFVMNGPRSVRPSLRLCIAIMFLPILCLVYQGVVMVLLGTGFRAILAFVPIIILVDMAWEVALNVFGREEELKLA